MVPGLGENPSMTVAILKSMQAETMHTSTRKRYFEGTIKVHNWVCLKIGDVAKWHNLPVENEDKAQIMGEPQLEPERQAACQVSAPGAC